MNFKKKQNCLLPTLLLVLFVIPAYASPPAAPLKFELTQPNGHAFTVLSRGSVYQHWLETREHITVMQSGDAWFYAESDPAGGIRPSNSPVGSLNAAQLKNWPRGLRPVARGRGRSFGSANSTANPLSQSAPEVGVPHAGALSPGINNEYQLYSTVPQAAGVLLTPNQNVLVLLVSFRRQEFDFSVGSFQNLMFGASGSVKDFFLENSYSSFTVVAATESDTTGISAGDTSGAVNDGIVRVHLNRRHPNSGGNLSNFGSIVSDAMSGADGAVDYASFDTDGDDVITSSELSIVLILAGYETAYGGNASEKPNIWGHKSSLASDLVLDGVALAPYTAFGEQHVLASEPNGTQRQASIGIMAHELGHLMLGLPDLYDVDGGSEGIGDWGLMAGGSWNGVGQSGDSPAQLIGWSKLLTGLGTAGDLASASVGEALMPITSGSNYRRIWLDQYQLGEHFMLENRQFTGFDVALPGAGLLLTHAGAAFSNADENNKLIDVEEADGLAELDVEVDRGDAGDVYPGSSSATSFTAISDPSSHLNSGMASGVSLQNITESGANILLDVMPVTLAEGGHLINDFARPGPSWGCNNTTIYTAQTFTNNSPFALIDGLEVALVEPATVDAHLYGSVVANVPTTLLASKTGVALSGGAFDRIMFDAPLAIASGASAVLVLKIQSQSYGYPAVFDDTAATSMSWISCDGVGAYSPMMDNTPGGDFAQRLLMSGRDTDGDANPDAIDTDDDDDGLTDIEEGEIGTDPLDADTDDDTVNDGIDAFPLQFAASVDVDGDGLPDAWNVGCDVTCQNASGLVLDDDPTSATCPEYVCTPFNRGWRLKLLIPGA
jgi:M6 family metalloprotease-like protein